MTANIYWQGFHLPMQVASEEISSTAGNYVDRPPSQDLRQDLSTSIKVHQLFLLQILLFWVFITEMQRTKVDTPTISYLFSCSE